MERADVYYDIGSRPQRSYAYLNNYFLYHLVILYCHNSFLDKRIIHRENEDFTAMLEESVASFNVTLS